MLIKVNKFEIVKADYNNKEYIKINDKFYVEYTYGNKIFLCKYNIVIECAPKESAAGYTYLNPIKTYEHKTLYQPDLNPEIKY